MLIDWGLKTCPSNAVACVSTRIETLLSQYRPNLVLVEERIKRRKKNMPRTLRHLQQIRKVCGHFGVATDSIRRTEIKTAFSRYGSTKQELALAVIHKLPQLSRWYPRRRKATCGEELLPPSAAHRAL